jgi:hypothetical protein
MYLLAIVMLIAISLEIVLRREAASAAKRGLRVDRRGVFPVLRTMENKPAN